jgi:hypothetical protein
MIKHRAISNDVEHAMIDSEQTCAEDPGQLTINVQAIKDKPKPVKTGTL